jgi:hypothetical protein
MTGLPCTGHLFFSWLTTVASLMSYSEPKGRETNIIGPVLLLGLGTQQWKPCKLLDWSGEPSFRAMHNAALHETCLQNNVSLSPRRYSPVKTALAFMLHVDRH